jgi:hypothetical protein
LIALSRKENDLIPVIGRYMPGAPIADLKAYTVVAETPGLGPEWKGAYLGDIDFAPDGSAVYLLPKGKDHVFELDPAFASSRKLVPAGARLTRLAALAVDPRDGRLWVASDARDELWSLDPRTSEARLEVSFVKEGVEGGSGKAILFPSPSLRFSNDGRRLVVSDAQGWVWVLEWE